MTLPPGPPAPALIPTRYREPIARDLAYPIGATQLSAALVGVPQFGELSISFSGVPYALRNTGMLYWLEHKPRLVLEAWFRNERAGFSGSANQIAQGEFGERWSLFVHAVPSRLKATVRAALGAEGLTVLRDWLAKPRTEVWRGARLHELEILYDLDARVMSWREKT